MSLDPNWENWPPEMKERLRWHLAARAHERAQAAWNPYPWQVPPGVPETQGMWLMLGGRGTGKTDGAARYVDQHVAGPPCDTRVRGGHRIAIIAPTLGDAVESCINGPSGLRAHNPAVLMRGGVGGTYARWPSGVEGKLFGAHTPQDIERLRSGGNRCLVWMEEIAAQRYLKEALEHSRFGLRIGARPHYVGSTTPKPRPEITALLADPRTLVTRGRTRDAIHLDQSVRDDLEARYAGTRLGRQELDGEVLEDVEGALWTQQMIDTDRIVVENLPPLKRVVVAIDPAVTSGEDADETGIIVAGTDQHGHVYILEDLTCRVSPQEWVRVARQAYTEYRADRIVAEANNGGDMVEAILRSQPGGTGIAYKKVTASRGKRVRAEPVSALYEQHRVHHVGGFPALEDQMCSWVPLVSDGSPDRMDALVWAVSELAVEPQRKRGAWSF